MSMWMYLRMQGFAGIAAMLPRPTRRGGHFLRDHAIDRARTVLRARRSCVSTHDPAREAISMQQERPRRRRCGVQYALALLCALAPCAAGAAQKVYRCADAAGPASYQDRPCADPAHQRVIELATPPPASPTAQATSPVPHAATAPRNSQRKAAPREAGPRAPSMSWECRAANGELFYRHSACPATIPGKTQRGGRPESVAVRVQAKPLPRRDACRRITAAGSIGRSGRERDETVTTYERNLGRDPCRRS